MSDIAVAAEVSTGLTYRYFNRKEDLVLALYEQLSENMAARLRLPNGSVGTRWAVLERTRFAVLAPHRRTLLALLQAAIDPEGELGVLSPATGAVRATWLRLHRAVVDGADESRGAPESLSRLLYALDLLLVLLWTQDRTANSRTTRAAIGRLAQLIDVVAPLLKLPVVSSVVAELDAIFQSLTLHKEKLK